MLAPTRKPVGSAPHPPTYSHSRTRTTSSSVFPMQPDQQQQQMMYQQQSQMHLQQPTPTMGHTRRSPSVNTFSTMSSTNQPPPSYRTSPPSADIRRSTSSRSGGGGQPTSYVALLRKQKATVWCDRAQSEDPRLVAQQRAAKQRANMAVIGGSSTGLNSRTTTGMSSANKVVTKIRHHGKPGVVGYTPENNSNYAGVGGVPVRLSATEVEGEDSDEDDMSMGRLHHRRTGSSGRSSTNSRRGPGYRTSTGAVSSNLAGGKKWSPGDTPERSGSLVEQDAEYDGRQSQLQDQTPDRAQSTRSGSSAERADAVADLGDAPKLASNSLLNAALTREKSVRNPEDLRRRGSVDERTMTMSMGAGRLFIANPD